VRIDGAELRVFLGSVAGETSPVRTFTPLLGAQLDLEPHATVTLSIDPGFEHGLLVEPGAVAAAVCARAGSPLSRTEWARYVTGTSYRETCPRP
jgi:redox-sensitive bicupin YhaK (pirin superfamily)